MLFKEVQSLKALNHKNIVKILNCFYLREDESFAIVLEYLDGGDLRKYINERGFLEE
jgi:serine/threonine protein kinase